MSRFSELSFSFRKVSWKSSSSFPFYDYLAESISGSLSFFCISSASGSSFTRQSMYETTCYTDDSTIEKRGLYCMDCLTCLNLSGEHRISPGPCIYQGKYWTVDHAYPTTHLG